MAPDNPCRYEGFGRDPQQLTERYAEIPEGLDVLITHSPPFGILDASVQYGGVPREAPIAIGNVALRDGRRPVPSARTFLMPSADGRTDHLPSVGKYFTKALLRLDQQQQ